MRCCLRLFCALAAISLFFPAPGGAAGEADPLNLKVIAQQPGSNFYGYSSTLAKLVEQKCPPGSRLDVVPRGGSMGNPTTLDQRKGDLAFSLVGSTAWAWTGLRDVYPAYGEHRNIRSVTMGLMNYVYTVAVARRSFVESTGLDSMEKIVMAKDMPRLAMKPQGSVVIPVVAAIFRSQGKVFEDVRKAGKLVQGQPSQIAEMLRDRRVDVYIDCIPVNHPGFVEATMTNDLVFLPFSPKMLEYMAKNMGMPPVPMPGGTYKGQKEDYPSPVDGQCLLAHKDVSENDVYRITKLLMENRSALIEENGPLYGWDPEKNRSMEGNPVPLHPGAARYYKEIGWLR